MAALPKLDYKATGLPEVEYIPEPENKEELGPRKALVPEVGEV